MQLRRIAAELRSGPGGLGGHERMRRICSRVGRPCVRHRCSIHHAGAACTMHACVHVRCLRRTFSTAVLSEAIWKRWQAALQLSTPSSQRPGDRRWDSPQLSTRGGPTAHAARQWAQTTRSGTKKRPVTRRQRTQAVHNADPGRQQPAQRAPRRQPGVLRAPARCGRPPRPGGCGLPARPLHAWRAAARPRRAATTAYQLATTRSGHAGSG